jgi:hypothetical protein
MYLSFYHLIINNLNSKPVQQIVPNVSSSGFSFTFPKLSENHKIVPSRPFDPLDFCSGRTRHSKKKVFPERNLNCFPSSIYESFEYVMGEFSRSRSYRYVIYVP